MVEGVNPDAESATKPYWTTLSKQQDLTVLQLAACDGFHNIPHLPQIIFPQFLLLFQVKEVLELRDTLKIFSMLLLQHTPLSVFKQSLRFPSALAHVLVMGSSV